MANLQLSSVKQLKDLPALRQLLVLAAIAAAVAAGLWLWSWSQQPGYTPVFSNLSDKDAADAAETLRTADIPYRTEGGGIAVPQSRLYDARLKLAAQGLPRGSSQGFELMQQEQGFGTSQFIETARYQHALETELARTIGGLQPVRGARVHLAIPKPSAFARKTDAPGASVFIELYAGRALESDQVASIVHLVASSVPGLVPDAVTVIDQFGHLLTNADPDSAMARSAEQFDYARRVEGDYAHRIEQLLTPMVGVGRINAQVAADIDFAEIEEAREQYAPDPQKIRSEQVSEDTTRGGKPSGGVPGATSNQPPPQTANPPLNNVVAGASGAGATAADEVQTQSKQQSRTYELDRTLSHTRQSVGRLKRLSIAVLVDNVPKASGEGDKQTMKPMPLSAEELAKVESLVKEAVGFDATRGDSVSVQNTSFITQELPEIEAVPIWQQPRVRDYAQQGGGILVVLALIVFILRPALRNLMNTPLQRLRSLESGSDASVGGTSTSGALQDDRVSLNSSPNELSRGAYEQKLQIARKAVNEDPKRVAQVVKTWIGQEGGG